MKDGTTIEIPPKFAPSVNKKFIAKEVIPLRFRSIPYSEVKDFRQSARRYTPHKLLEEVSQVFKEPIVVKQGEQLFFHNGKTGKVEYEAWQASWVKKEITSELWQRKYAASPGYYMLEGDNGMCWIAWRYPTHLIDRSNISVVVCTPNEVDMLDKKAISANM